jgi:1-acyl-sn-glycerol-3-phosphate acyltransferase
MGRYLLKVYTVFMLRLDFRNRNTLPKGPKIIVANHPTTSDPFYLTALTKGRSSILIKDILFAIPVFGWYLRYTGHIPVAKLHGRAAFNEALKKLRNGISVIIFIEGNVTGFLDKLSRPKTGAVRLSLLTSVPIVPIGIGVDERMVFDINSTINGVVETGRWYLKGPYILTIGKSIYFKGSVFNIKKIQENSLKLMETVRSLAKKSSDRIKN